MVHLSTVDNDSEVNKGLGGELSKIKLEQPDDNEVESVYGSRFAAEGLPSGAMPDGEMPRDVAYRLINDHLSLDGNPVLNLASFVTT
jgi:glutamate decarboxylase